MNLSSFFSTPIAFFHSKVSQSGFWPSERCLGTSEDEKTGRGDLRSTPLSFSRTPSSYHNVHFGALSSTGLPLRAANLSLLSALRLSLHQCCVRDLIINTMAERSQNSTWCQTPDQNLCLTTKAATESKRNVRSTQSLKLKHQQQEN